MTSRPVRSLSSGTWLLAVLAGLAYLPAFGSSPGKMPADSKLYLYLDPGRFLTTAATTFDATQYGGWVPHQHIGYLWPVGPYFALAELVGLPDWVAHRLWIGTLLWAAGAGVWTCCRRFGFAPLPAFAGGLVYQLSPYVLPYISRTSVMLLPWAGLGWIMAVTIVNTSRPPVAGATVWSRWSGPATVALIVATVGSINATALLMIAPAPTLWLLYSAVTARTTAGGAIAFGVRTAVACIGVSLWWVAMLIIQGRYGARVLPFSETLEDVSFTSSAAEVWRGLGYWLFYVRDVGGPATTSSWPYQASGTLILVTFAVPLVGLIGLCGTNWPDRWFGLLCVGTGGILAVGSYPFDASSPLVSVFGGEDSGLTLALRSSTRAIPVLSLGLALGTAAGIASLPLRRRWVQPAGTVLVLVLTLAAMPSLRGAELVDPALTRTQDPPVAWTAAAAHLDADGTSADQGRVWQLPGIEFGAYRWGITVDQPQPGLSERWFISRDLLPLGSPTTMDVLYEADDRVQQRTATVASLGGAAKVLGVDTIWLAGDLAYDRYRTARATDVVDAASELGSVTEFGEPQPDVPSYQWIDERTLAHPGEAFAPVVLIDLDEPSDLITATPQQIAVSGSGAAFVDSHAVQESAERAGIVYTADMDPAELQHSAALVVTDSNRNRNRHWRSSQDAVGATLSADDPVSARERSQRLHIFDNTDLDTQTIALQDGPLRAYAREYGEPFGYLPERRAAMAIDGDPTTAWTVGEHGDPVGAEIVLHTETDVDELRFAPYAPIPGQRTISALTVETTTPAGDADTTTLRLTDDGTTTNDAIVAVVNAPAGSEISIRIDAVSGGTPHTEGIVADVGLREIIAVHDGVELASTTEWLRTPVDAVTAATDADVPIAYSMRRERVAPDDHWRDDPEPTLRRVIDIGAPSPFQPSVEVRLDPHIDDRALADLLHEGAWASTRLKGSLLHRGGAAVDDDPNTAWISAFGEARGAILYLGATSANIDRITITQPNPSLSQVRRVGLSTGGQEQLVDVPPTGVIELNEPLAPGNLTLRVIEIEEQTTIDRRYGDRRELPVSISQVDIPNLEPAAPFESTASDCVEVATIDNVPLYARLDITPEALAGNPVDTSWCDLDPLSLDVGEARVAGPTDSVVNLDAIELRTPRFDDVLRELDTQPVVEVSGSFDDNGRGATIELNGCEDGCWLAVGSGYNSGWRAEIGGHELGSPVVLNGASNGWWIDPATVGADDGQLVVDISWPVQRWLTWAMVVSILVVALCLALVVAHHTMQPKRPAQPVPLASGSWTLGRGQRVSQRNAIVLSLWMLTVSWFFAGVMGALIGTIIGTIAIVLRRPRTIMLTPPLLLAITAVYVIAQEIEHRYLPDATWPNQFRDIHSVAMTAFALCVAIGTAGMATARRRIQRTG